MNTPKPGGKLQREGQHHIKPKGLRMGCRSSSYACEGRSEYFWQYSVPEQLLHTNQIWAFYEDLC